MPYYRAVPVDMDDLICPHCECNEGFYGYSVESFTQTLNVTLYEGELEFEVYDSEYCDTIEQSYRCCACDSEVSPHRITFRNENQRNVARAMQEQNRRPNVR